MDGNASTPLKISVSLLKDNANQSKHRIHVLTRIPNLHSRIPNELKRASYLPDLTINRKISSTKILEPDEIFGLNNVTGGIRHSIKPIKKKEPLRIMSNKTFEEMKSPANAQTLAPVVTNDRIDDAPLFPTYFNGRLRYPREEGIVIAKSVNGPKIGYRANLRIMKLKAVQERLMAEKGIRGFFNIKTTSKDNSRENSVNLELSITAKKKDNILDEALNELKDSMTIVESNFLGNSRS
jgi:hypothetical protein